MTEAQGTDRNTLKETRVQFTNSRRIVLCLITDSYLECRARLEFVISAQFTNRQRLRLD